MNILFAKMKLKRYCWMLKEAKILTFLAFPTAISYLTEGMQAKLSNVFIGRSSGSEVTLMLSALYIAQMFSNATSYPLGLGIAAYVNILCSQAFGAKQYKMVGLYFYRILFMSALTIFPLCALYISARPIVYLVTQDWQLAYQVGRYATVYCFILPAYLYQKAAIGYLQASGVVWPPLLYLLLGNALNGILQYIFIFHFDTGLAGAGAGYCISTYLIALLIYAHIRFTNIHILTNVDWTVELIGQWYHTMQYALSTTIQSFGAIFQTGISPMIILGIIARSETQLAIYSILYSVWFAFCLFAFGYSSAITIRIGHILGANEPNKARRVAIFSLIYCLIIIILISSFVCMTSQPFSILFTTDAMLASDLSFGVKMLAIVIFFAGVCLLQQGVMNACCQQRIDAVQNFILRLVVSFVISIIVAHYVEWKALSLLMVMTILMFLSTVIGLLIVFCQRWEKFAALVRKNTEKDISQVDYDNLVKNNSVISHFLCNGKVCDSKLFIITRYCSCMLLGIIFFIFIFVR